MAFEHKTNTGSIFKNDYKKSERHPDYKGQVNVGGTLYDIALWVKDGQKGKFFSAAISEPYHKPETAEDIEKAEAQAIQDEGNGKFDTGIPF